MRILVLPGDGIGWEITESTLRVLNHVDNDLDLGLEIEVAEIGLAAHAATGTTLPPEVLARVGEVDGTILGPVSHYDYPPHEEGGVNPSAALRTTYALHSNIRPSTSVPGLSPLRAPLDVVVVRENTEGFYADRNMHRGLGEFMPDEDTALAIRKISARACRAVAEQAFALAELRRRHVTAVHKANVLRLTDGLFLREVRAVAARHPEVTLRELIVDAAAALLIRDPESFDVLVTTNMFGDILSDEASELAGSLGLGGSISVGAPRPGMPAVCVAQAQHGSAPDIAGQGIANPVSLIRSAAMLLIWAADQPRLAERRIRLLDAGRVIDAAVTAAVTDPSTRTRDLGGTLSTHDFTTDLLHRIESLDDLGAAQPEGARHV